MIMLENVVQYHAIKQTWSEEKCWKTVALARWRCDGGRSRNDDGGAEAATGDDGGRGEVDGSGAGDEGEWWETEIDEPAKTRDQQMKKEENKTPLFLS